MVHGSLFEFLEKSGLQSHIELLSSYHNYIWKTQGQEGATKLNKIMLNFSQQMKVILDKSELNKEENSNG